MEIKEQSGFYGEYEIEIIDTITGNQEIHKIKNTLTNINKDIHLAMLLGVTTGKSLDDLNIRYFAFGSEGAAANSAQTRLINEKFRKQVTAKLIKDNYVESIVSLGSVDANKDIFPDGIKEIGIFAGSQATDSFNTGNMISRISVNIEKFENKIINIIRRDFVNI